MKYSKWFWLGAIAAIWAISRLYYYSTYHDALLHVMRVNDSNFWHMWYIPAPLLEQNLWQSMLQLRGEPPLPQLIAGLLMKLQSWPFSQPLDSWLLSVFSLCTATILFHVITLLRFQPWLATIAAASWLLHPGIITAELEALPTCLYELLPSFLFVLSVFCLIKFQQYKLARWLWCFGGLAVLLSLSRSTLTYFFVIPWLILPLLPAYRYKWVIALLPILFQGMWAVKNYAIYDEFFIETSSDLGQNLVSTIINTKQLNSFVEFHAQRNPNNALINLVLHCQPDESDPAKCQRFFEDVSSKDLQLKEQTLIGDKLFGESYQMSKLTREMKPLFIEYVLFNPDRAVQIFFASYKLFWGDLLKEITHIQPLLEDNYLTKAERAYNAIQYLQLAIIHCFGIALFLFLLKPARNLLQTEPAMIGFIFCAIGYSYIAIFSSFGDHSENARYRLAVEALVWLMPFFIWRGWQLWLSERR